MSTTRYSPNKYHIAHNNSDCNILGHRIRGGFKNHSHGPIFRCFARKLLSSPASTIHLVKMNMNAETDKKTDFWTATLNWLLIKGRKSDRSAPPCETLQQCNVQLWNRAMCNSCHLPDRLQQRPFYCSSQFGWFWRKLLWYFLHGDFGVFFMSVCLQQRKLVETSCFVPSPLSATHCFIDTSLVIISIVRKIIIFALPDLRWMSCSVVILLVQTDFKREERGTLL